MHATLATLALLTSLFTPESPRNDLEARLALARQLEATNPDQALRTYRLGCALDVGFACLAAASLGQELEVPGARVARWTERGIALTAASCQGTDPSADPTNACGMLAAIYGYGQGVPADPARAAAYGALALGGR